MFSLLASCTPVIDEAPLRLQMRSLEELRVWCKFNRIFVLTVPVVYLWTKNIYVRYSYRTCKGFDLPMNPVTDGGSIDVYCLVHHGSSIAMLGNAFSKPWSVSPLENASSVSIALYFLIRALEDNSYIRFKISCLGADLKSCWSAVEASGAFVYVHRLMAI